MLIIITTQTSFFLLVGGYILVCHVCCDITPDIQTVSCGKCTKKLLWYNLICDKKPFRTI